MVHEFQHVQEILSGRLQAILKTFEALRTHLLITLGEEYLKAHSASGHRNWFLLQFAYSAVTELTAERAGYDSDQELKKKFPSFRHFAESGAFYSELYEKIQSINLSLTKQREESSSEEDKIFFNAACGFIRASVEKSLVEADKGELFSACF